MDDMLIFPRKIFSIRKPRVMASKPFGPIRHPIPIALSMMARISGSRLANPNAPTATTRLSWKIWAAFTGPIDQVEKFSLMRYSKGHRGISCQSCHQSTHGLYPVTEKGADPVSLSQAKALNPDGHARPIKCGICHAVDLEGVPTIVTDAMLSPHPKEV